MGNGKENPRVFPWARGRPVVSVVKLLGALMPHKWGRGKENPRAFPWARLQSVRPVVELLECADAAQVGDWEREFPCVSVGV